MYEMRELPAAIQAAPANPLDLLAARRDLARAHFTDIQSRADLLRSAAALVFAAGE